MKMIVSKSLCAFCCAMLLWSLCGCDSGSTFRDEPLPEQIHSIAYLKSLCRDRSYRVSEDLIIEGQVVSSNRFREFDRRLVLQDQSGGVTVAVESPSIADLYPYGSVVQLYANGLTLLNYGGKVLLGDASDEYGIRGIDEHVLYAHLRVVPSDAAPKPCLRTFAEITEADIDTFVQFDDVRFVEQDTWCGVDSLTNRYRTTERMIENREGQHFVVRTSGRCAYAKQPLPKGWGRLWGIVNYFNGTYSLQVVNHGVDF